MRAFVAVPVGDAVRDALANATAQLAKAGADVKWVERHNVHLTLKFLGDLPEAAIDKLRGHLREEAARWAPIALEVRGLGRYPSHGPPRVVWAGCRGDVARATALEAAITRHAESVGGVLQGRAWTPHLTLGRVRSDRRSRALDVIIASAADTPFGSLPVSAFVLYKSTLTPDGPVYEPIETFTLKT
jgi:RNA 2',3'-cyclic 3'-phosphodiesterase